MKRIRAGRPRVPHDIQYCGVSGGDIDVGGILRSPVGAARDGMGVERAQPDIFRGQWKDRWEVPHLGKRRPDGVSCNVPTDGTGDEPGEYKGPGVHPRVHLGGVE